MDNQGVKLVIQQIADDLLMLAASVLEDDTVSTNSKVGRNTLFDSNLLGDLEDRIAQMSDGNPIIQALFNNYVVFLEWERPPKYKRKPPISALKEWAAKNGIPTDADTLWAISYAIWRDGHAGRPIFATIDKLADSAFMDDWSDKLFNAITDDLDKLFNAA